MALVPFELLLKKIHIHIKKKYIYIFVNSKVIILKRRGRERECTKLKFFNKCMYEFERRGKCDDYLNDLLIHVFTSFPQLKVK